MKALLLVVFMSFPFLAKAKDCRITLEGFGLLGTSIYQGQPYPGVRKAYAHFDKMGFWKTIHSPYKNFGAMPFKEALSIYEDLYYKTLEILQKGFRPALIGGDHSQSFATISALLKHDPDLRVLWLDAHADINTSETSLSGNTHGMPVAGLMGFTNREPWNYGWLNQNLKAHQLIYLGIRDLDKGEIELIDTHNIENYTPQAFRKIGLKNVLMDISKKWKNKAVHLSFDIDVLDSSLAPATGTPSSKGLTMEETLEIINWIKKELHFISFELTEFNPDLAKTTEELRTTERTVQTILSQLLNPIK